MTAVNAERRATQQLLSNADLRWREDTVLDLGPRVRPELVATVMILAVVAAVLFAFAMV